MAHKAIDKITPQTPFTSYHTYELKDVFRDDSSNNRLVGEYKRERLCQTTVNPKDSTGFRMPSAYCGSFQLRNTPTVNYSGQYLTTVTNPKEDDWDKRTGYMAEITSPSFVSSLTSLSTKLNRLEDIAKTRALSKFADGTIDLSVAFGERKQTAQMLEKTVLRVVKFTRSLKKAIISGKFDFPPGMRDIRSLRLPDLYKVVGETSSLWLEYRYGWTPLIYDVQGAIEEIERLDNGHYDRYVVSSKHGQTRTEDETLTAKHPTYGQFWGIPASSTTIRNLKYFSRVRIDATITDPQYMRMQSMGLTNPMNTLFELTTLSFVLDWAINAGDFLVAINATKGLKFKAGSVTKGFDESLQYYVAADPSASKTPNRWRNLGLTHGVCGYYQSAFNRSVLTSFPTPKLVFKREMLSTTHMLDAIALLSQQLTKGSKRR